METKTKVVIGVGVVVVVVAVGAVVYFKVIKPKKIAEKAKQDAEEAARIAQLEGKSQEQVVQAAQNAAAKSAGESGASKEQTQEIVKETPTVVKEAVAQMAKGSMGEDIKPSNIAIAKEIHDSIDGFQYSPASKNRRADAVYKFLRVPSDNDFRQIYRAYKEIYKENIFAQIFAEAMANDFKIGLTKRALVLKLNIK